MEDNNFTYDAFISYRHVEPDRAYAKWLRKALENYRVPADMVARGYPKRIKRVCRDEEELPASASLSLELNRILEQSRFLIVICSPRVVESAWCDAEVMKFRELGRHGQIIALLIEGEPSQSFLPSLREIRKHVIKEDGVKVEELESVEPLAADVRPRPEQGHREIKQIAKLRILASILGCKFDDLRRRELRRRQRQMTIVVASLVALVVCFSGLTLWALHERGLANEQTGVAKSQTRLANRQTAIAKTQTRLANEQKVLAEKNAKEVRRKLAQHYQYRANELLTDTNDNQRAENELQAITLLTEAMRVSETFRESISERIKLQYLLTNRLVPDEIYYHETPQSFHAFKNNVILTCGLDSSVQLWDATDNRKIGKALSFEEPLKDAVFSENGELVAVFDAKYTWVISCSTGEIISKPLEILSSYKYSDQYALMPDRPVISEVKFIDTDRLAVMCSAALKVFDIKSGNVDYSSPLPENYVFKSMFVLDSQHLLVGFWPAFLSKNKNYQRNSQIISISGETNVREEESPPGKLIMPGTGAALVSTDHNTSLRHLVDNKTLVEFPRTKKNDFVNRAVSPDSSVVAVYTTNSDQAEVYLADVQGQQITIPEFARENLWKLFLLDDEHLLVAYHSPERRAEVWNFITGELKASTPIEDLPDLCCANNDVSKVAYSSEKSVFLWDLDTGLSERFGWHLNPVKLLAFSGSTHCLSSDGEVIKKWVSPSSVKQITGFTWSRGKLDFIDKLVFGENLVAFPGSDDEKSYFSVYDMDRHRLLADSIEIPNCEGFHWTPCRFSENGDYFLVPYRDRRSQKRFMIWDTQSKKIVQLDLPVPIHEIVQISRSEIVYLGKDNQIHFHSFADSKHESLMLGPLRDSYTQLSPDRQCVLIEGTERAFIVNLETRRVVFDQFFIWPSNKDCWIAQENAVWCIAKKQLCKINWLTGEVLFQASHRDTVEDLTCIPDRNLLISHGANVIDRVKTARSLKFWDLAGRYLDIEVPSKARQELYRSVSDEYLHFKEGDTFKTISTDNLKVNVRSDSFLEEHLESAAITYSTNRKYLIVRARNHEFRVYDTLTMEPLSKPFALKEHNLVKAVFHTFKADDELMVFSGRESIDLYQTTTGYRISSIPVNGYLDVPRDLERSFRVVDSPSPNQLILVNESKNELAFLDIASATQDFEELTSLQTVISEQHVDSTNAVVPTSKLEVTAAFRKLQQTTK